MLVKALFEGHIACVVTAYDENVLKLWRTFSPLSFRRPIRRPVPRLSACPDLLPIVATGVRAGFGSRGGIDKTSC